MRYAKKFKSDSIEIQKFLSDVDYPADKRTLLGSVKENGADENAIEILQELPEKTYNSPTDVSRHVHKYVQ